MSNFYFFTDPGLLALQAAEQSFGPAGDSAGKDKFRVTDVHTSSSSALPAVAICDGILCAQEDNEGTLTLILKPSQSPPFESPVVSYFIYKGVGKTSLLDATDGRILDENASAATDFTKRIAAEWKKQNKNDLTGSRAALGLDRGASFKHDDGASQINIFTDNDLSLLLGVIGLAFAVSTSRCAQWLFSPEMKKARGSVLLRIMATRDARPFLLLLPQSWCGQSGTVGSSRK